MKDLVLSFHLVGPGNPAPAVRLGGKHLHLLSRLFHIGFFKFLELFGFIHKGNKRFHLKIVFKYKKCAIRVGISGIYLYPSSWEAEARGLLTPTLLQASCWSLAIWHGGHWPRRTVEPCYSLWMSDPSDFEDSMWKLKCCTAPYPFEPLFLCVALADLEFTL